MIMDLDIRPENKQSDNLSDHTAFYAIRLRPETNQEMAKLEFLTDNTKDMERIINMNEVHYLVLLKNKGR